MNGLWQWEIVSGRLYRPDGAWVAECYSGHGAGVDNPELESTRQVGPLPEGTYDIGPLEVLHGTLGRHVRKLTPTDATNVYHRSGFFIHGDNATLDHSASEGCLVPWKLSPQPPTAQSAVRAPFYPTLRMLRDDMEGQLKVYVAPAIKNVGVDVDATIIPGIGSHPSVT